MITLTPRLAVIASSWIVGILITSIVMNPTVSVSSATMPGAMSCMKAARAAVGPSWPLKASLRKVQIFWTPWLTPIAKTRNGTRMENGSMP